MLICYKCTCLVYTMNDFLKLMYTFTVWPFLLSLRYTMHMYNNVLYDLYFMKCDTNNIMDIIIL